MVSTPCQPVPWLVVAIGNGKNPGCLEFQLALVDQWWCEHEIPADRQSTNCQRQRWAEDFWCRRKRIFKRMSSAIVFLIFWRLSPSFALEMFHFNFEDFSFFFLDIFALSFLEIFALSFWKSFLQPICSSNLSCLLFVSLASGSHHLNSSIFLSLPYLPLQKRLYFPSVVLPWAMILWVIYVLKNKEVGKRRKFEKEKAGAMCENLLHAKQAGCWGRREEMDFCLDCDLLISPRNISTISPASRNILLEYHHQETFCLWCSVDKRQAGHWQRGLDFGCSHWSYWSWSRI